LQAGHIYFHQVTQVDPPAQIVVIAKELRDSFDTHVHVFEENNRHLISLDGYSYVYAVDSNFKVSNLYKGRYHRYNIGAHKWYFDNYIYAYGGSLLWNFFSEVIFFKEDVGGWEIQNYVGPKPIPIDTTPHLIFFFKERLNVIFLKSTLYVEGNTFYEYDFSDFTWRRRGRIKEGLIPERYVKVDLDNYVVLLTEDGKGKIIDKENLIISSIDSVHQAKEMIFYTYLDEIIIRDGVSNAMLLNVNLPKVYDLKNGVKLVKFSFPWESLFLLLAIPLVLIFKRKRIDSNIFPYPKLLRYKGEIIDQEILDNCLGVNFYSSISSKRNKRSKTILLINQKYSAVVTIERIRNDEDSRMFKYKVW
jgi:hypothetical protein